ncbi:MAG TPA: hypothetical protein DCY13_03815, partial [Verrucomicrobiales bacterium]|nr:hypothetical protein [Verrucomicrobiales bacterium]
MANTASPSESVAPRHWPEYLMEGALLGLFMISAGVVGVLLEHPDSTFRKVLASPDLRRALGGVAMGLTAIALIHSPWGKQSGAHFNPAVTINFWRLGKMRGADAAGYLVGQFTGGVLGIVGARWLMGTALADPAVNWVATVPGATGFAAAAIGEFTIAFLHILAILFISNHPRMAPYTGWFAGLLVATWITFEGPFSGMSMNPARTFASALPGNIWTGWWIYFTAPVLGMLTAGFVFGALRAQRPVSSLALWQPPRAR